MKSPLDGSELKQIRAHLYEDSAHGYVITDIGTVKKQYEGQVQALQTQEMKLDTLGVFPLAKPSLPLLEKELSFGGTSLTVIPLFRKSQIPLFSDASGKQAYIPSEGANICRYIYDLWKLDEEPVSDTDAVLGGFAILASYAGL